MSVAAVCPHDPVHDPELIHETEASIYRPLPPAPWWLPPKVVSEHRLLPPFLSKTTIQLEGDDADLFVMYW
jgi:hypothetical protein